MHVGMSIFFQNPDHHRNDRDVWRHELAMADLAEPLGFDSIWSAEHHFSDYTMCPNVNQFLTYMAGRTQRVQLGSMVTVLPWHDPVRVAEEVSVLDHVSNGRALLGIGRGLGRIEFENFRLNMGESRERFTEYAETILDGLETGYLEYDGKILKQPRAPIKPGPFKSFRGRTYAAAVSPASASIVARLGAGVLMIPQKPWATAVAELDEYRRIYHELNGVDAPPPLVASWVACHESEERAREMMQSYIRRYSLSAVNHYEFWNRKLAKVKGYEYYGKLADRLANDGVDKFVDFLTELQVYGTPAQVYEKLTSFHELTGANGVITVFSYGGMPEAEAHSNVELFAREVLPELQRFDAGPPVGEVREEAVRRV